jgi:hypothetical protein
MGFGWLGGGSTIILVLVAFALGLADTPASESGAAPEVAVDEGPAWPAPGGEVPAWPQPDPRT